MRRELKVLGGVAAKLQPVFLDGAWGADACEKIWQRFDGILKFLSNDSRLDDGDEVFGADFLDAVHAFQGEGDAAPHRNAASDVAKTRASRCDRNSMPVSELKDFRDRSSAGGQSDGIGHPRREPLVAAVLGAEFRIPPKFTARERTCQ